MEPVAIACHVLLHRDVEIRLEYWNPRHVDERFADETLDARLVSRVIAFRCGFARRVDERIHVLILVAHGVEDRILAVVGPEEEVFRVIEPARKEIHDQRHVFLDELVAPIGAGNFVDRRLDADLGEALLNQHAGGLPDDGGAEVERERRLEAFAVPGFRE